MWTLIAEQTLNGVALGVLLFLLAAGLTLVLGVLNLVNLAHGSLYMLGAYFAVTFVAWTGSFVVGGLLAVAATVAAGIAVEFAVLRTLYARSHLDQLLATFGLVLFFNEVVHLVWGPAGRTLAVPQALAGHVSVLPGLAVPAYRLAVVAVGLSVAAGLYALIVHTRAGMLVRAGASNRPMAEALGVNIPALFTALFALGAALAALAGILAAPLVTLEIGMGDNILILAFVVIVVGGIGSIRGAFAAALGIGLIDTLGRAFLPEFLEAVLPPNAAATVAPAISSVLIYAVMAAVLALRPSGLFAAGRG